MQPRRKRGCDLLLQEDLARTNLWKSGFFVLLCHFCCPDSSICLLWNCHIHMLHHQKWVCIVHVEKKRILSSNKTCSEIWVSWTWTQWDILNFPLCQTVKALSKPNFKTASFKEVHILAELKVLLLFQTYAELNGNPGNWHLIFE